MPVKVIYIAAGLLFAAILPLPYGYYTLLRLVATGVFAWAAVIEFQKDQASIYTWGFALGGLLFNPLKRKHCSGSQDFSHGQILIAQLEL